MGRLPLVFLGLSLYFLGSIILERGYSLTLEDGIFETLTAVFYLAGSLFCLIGFVAIRRRGPSPGKYLLLGWAVLFLFFGMEEISWGQRVFGLETPEFLASSNLQDETNLHNLNSVYANRLFYSSVFLVGVVLPSLVVFSSRFDSFIGHRGIPLPQPELIVPFALAFTFASPEWMSTAPEFVVLLTATVVGLSLAIKTNVLQKDMGVSNMSNLHLWIGLGGVLLILLALLVFEDKLRHINQPNEIKEFLFSACFLVFAHRRLSFARIPSSLRRIPNVAD